MTDAINGGNVPVSADDLYRNRSVPMTVLHDVHQRLTYLVKARGQTGGRGHQVTHLTRITDVVQHRGRHTMGELSASPRLLHHSHRLVRRQSLTNVIRGQPRDRRMLVTAIRLWCARYVTSASNTEIRFTAMDGRYMDNGCQPAVPIALDLDQGRQRSQQRDQIHRISIVDLNCTHHQQSSKAEL